MWLKELFPTERHRVMDLVRIAGVDVNDWENYDGAAAANPKYCYEWSFIEPHKVVVLSISHLRIREIDGLVVSAFSLLQEAASETNAQRKARAKRMDQYIRSAFCEGLPVRVIVWADKSLRRLDDLIWSVATYDFSTGHFQVVRGRRPVPAEYADFDQDIQGFEGEVRMRFVHHRTREAKLRDAKIREAKRLNNGRLICEVPRCGFDFAQRYGTIGENYAEVHHLEPLSSASDSGRGTGLSDLAVVCANCHAMIHVGGKCRNLCDLIPS